MDQKKKEKEPKIFNDPIHGNISFNPACVAIMDTPQFQRLRHLKQLGGVYSVYPGAGHNRFEHCLGVCYLAGRLVRHLKNQKDLREKNIVITDQDVLCVEIAGLCHDLGHGPFSHTFDRRFIPSVVKTSERTWTHEDASKDLFDHLVEKNKLEEGVFKNHKLAKDDLVFIKELISPKAWGESEPWPNKGRGKEKAFLYEIVANKRTGIDVDKFDYLARDCFQVGIRNNFDHKRFIKFTRVIEVDGQWQICLRDKEVLNLYNMFLTRYTLHKVACLHRAVCAIELMVAHAMIKSNDHILIKGTNGEECKMSECIDDMEAYTQLTDNIIFKILYTESDNSEMKEAQKLLQRVLRRDLYKCVYESPPIDPKILEKKTEEVIKKEIMNIASPTQPEDELIVEIVKLDFGKGVKNPMESLKVFSKDNPGTGRRLAKREVSTIMAFNYSERLVRVYTCRERPKEDAERTSYYQHTNKIKEAGITWFKQHVRDEDDRADDVPSRPDSDGGAEVQAEMMQSATLANLQD